MRRGDLILSAMERQGNACLSPAPLPQCGVACTDNFLLLTVLLLLSLSCHSFNFTTGPEGCFSNGNYVAPGDTVSSANGCGTCTCEGNNLRCEGSNNCVSTQAETQMNLTESLCCCVQFAIVLSEWMLVQRPVLRARRLVQERG